MSAEYQARTILADEDLMASLAQYPSTFASATQATDYAMYQYTSGTTRELPEAVKHTHRSIVTLMVAALYGTGLRPGDRFSHVTAARLWPLPLPLPLPLLPALPTPPSACVRCARVLRRALAPSGLGLDM